MQFDYQHILDCIDPSLTNRHEWVRVGMALKYEGQPFEMFDRWSARDGRPNQYQGSDATARVWASFTCSGMGVVTGATLTEIARQQGNDPYPSGPISFMDWSDSIVSDGESVKTVSGSPVRTPVLKERWKPPFQMIKYLESCFKPDDLVNIISSTTAMKDGKLAPFGAGLFSIPVSQYIKELQASADEKDAVEQVIGSYDKETGVWIRINPINGKLGDDQRGFMDRNVTRFDNALIESDEMEIEDQLRMIQELRLPYKALVYSGKKSVHAIIGVNAKSYADYQERIGFLQDFCNASGFKVDTQNKNPSRLSRLPGIVRGDKKQTLLDVQTPEDFDEWRRWAVAEMEGQKLEVDSYESVFDNLPEKSPELIHNVLRRGHKMLISGPSKAGKSFSLISLAAAVAEGKEWMGYKCEMGKVLYLNLEIDAPSFYHRIADVYKARGWKTQHPENIDVMNLRGKAEPLNTLGPKLEAKLRRTHYDLVIFDPIYKIITGDENSAGDMGAFCNRFDSIARAGDCSVAYCHHHSKGSQAGKSAIDRASGSGVFARDPDAIIDLTQLHVSDLDRAEFKEQMRERVIDRKLRETGQWENLEKVHPEMLKNRLGKEELVEEHFKIFPNAEGIDQYYSDLDRAEEIGDGDAFRLSMVLREFKSPPDAEVVFSYPVHVTDPTGFLKGLFLEGEAGVEVMNKKREENYKKRDDKKRELFEEMIESGPVSITEMMEAADCSRNSIKKWVDKQDDLKFGNGWIVYEDDEIPAQKRRTKKATDTQELEEK